MNKSLTKKFAVLCCLVGLVGSSALGDDFLIDRNTVETVIQPAPAAKINVRLKEVGAVLKAEAMVAGKTLLVGVAPAESHHTTIYFLVDVSGGQNKNKEFRNEMLTASGKIVQQMADRLLPAADYTIGLGKVGSSLMMFSNSSPDKQGRTALLNTIAVSTPDSASEIYRCTLEAVDQLKRSPAMERKVIVLFTSGKSDDKDRADSPDGLIEEANRQGISVFTVGFVPAGQKTSEWESLRRIAKETGGAFIETTADSKHLPQNGDPGLELLGMLKSAALLTVPLADVPAGAQNLTLKLTVRSSVVPLVGSVPIEVPAASAPAPAPTPTLTPAPTPTSTPALTVESTPAMSPAPATAAPTASPDPSHKESGAEARPAWLWAAIAGGALALLGLLIFLIVKATRGPKPLPPSPFSDEPIPGGGWGDDEEPAPGSNADGKGNTESGTQLAHGWLEEIDKDNVRGTRHPINKSKINLGRSADSDLRFEPNSVSLHHATVHRRSDGNFVITDLRASNGVYVNGKRVEHTVLKDGDIIEVGVIRLRFVRNESVTAK